MLLAVCGQDLRRFELVLWEDGLSRASIVTDDPPEMYLSRIDAFFQEQSVSLTDLSTLLVVTGPGSFTASRISVTLVNTLAFTENLPIVPLENTDRLPLLELLRKTDITKLASVVHASPHYDRPPFITFQKGAVDDSLGANP